MNFRALAIAAVCGSTPPAMAAEDFSGQYSGSKDSYRWSATIAPNGGGTYKVNVSVGSKLPACLGEISVVGRLKGRQLVTEPPEKGDACVLTITHQGGGIAIQEDDCSTWHGLACSFASQMTRKVGADKTLPPVITTPTPNANAAAHPSDTHEISPASAPQPPATAALVIQGGGKLDKWMSVSQSGRIDVTGVADDGESHFGFSCFNPPRGLNFNFDADGYQGHVLKKILDLEQTFVFEIHPASGNSQKFSVLAYFDGDGDWTQEAKRHLTGSEAAAFLDAFAQDGHLGLQTEKGVEVAAWTLNGTSSIRKSVRKVCNF